MQVPWRQSVLMAGCLAIGVSGAVLLARQPDAPAPLVRSAATSDDPFAEPAPTPPVNVAPVNIAPTNAPPPAPVRATGIVKVSGKDDAGSHPNDGRAVTLPAGTYTLTLEGGCYRPKVLGKWNAADLRVSYANRDAVGTPVGIAWSNLGEFKTEKECAAKYRESTRAIHHAGGEVAFWIADANGRDNMGDLTIRYMETDAPSAVTATFTCSTTAAAKGDVVTVSGRASGIGVTPIAIALPTGGAAPMRFLVSTNADGAFAMRVPVSDHPTDALMIDALWPVPDAGLVTASAPCTIPVSGTAAGYRTSGIAYYRSGTPEKPIFSPEDPYASTRVRVNPTKTPPLSTAIARIEFDANPTGTATPKRAIRFLRLVSDIDLAFVQNGIVRFTLLKPEVTKYGAPASNVVIVKFDAKRKAWVALPTTTIKNRGSMTVAEARINAVDLRDTTFALMAKR